VNVGGLCRNEKGDQATMYTAKPGVVWIWTDSRLQSCPEIAQRMATRFVAWKFVAQVALKMIDGESDVWFCRCASSSGRNAGGRRLCKICLSSSRIEAGISLSCDRCFVLHSVADACSMTRM
jgi:hypothetical protein